MSSLVRVCALHRAMVLTLALLASAPLGIAHAADGAVSTLIGNWGGSGRISYTDGSAESIRCTGYYTGDGNDLRMAIRCQSDKNPIDIRSQLKIEGNRVSGDWEERTFNASGTGSGHLSGSTISLRISGGGLTGSMSVSFSKPSHKVTIATQGIPMKGVTINFSRR